MQNEPEKGEIKFRSAFSYIEKESEQEEKSSMEPSQTVPDMTLSLQELVQRYTRGQSVATFTPVYYGEDEEFADVSRMDPIERIEYARYIREQISTARHSLAEHQAADEGGAEPQTSGGKTSTEETTPQNV
jgi:acyl-CoA reductase-like NAD-dependent aldehyde dehydrogenase